MDSSTIIEMNRLLGKGHVERIRMTPFRWCLHILSPLEVNLKLLKVMVCQWAGHDISFRVSQQLVPFFVFDVFMSTCLEIGGLDIAFDESVVGLIGEMFNPKTTTLKDLIDMFNVIVQDKNIEVDVDVPAHIAMVPLNLEWYVSNQDRELPEIRAAFHMDDEGMGEGSLAERSRVEEDDDESSDDGTWEAGAEERMRKNNRDIIALNAKIEVLKRELIEICQTPIFNEEATCGTDEEVGGGRDEAPAGGGDEDPAGGGDCGFEEEAADGAAEDPTSEFNEVGGDDETAHEDEKVSTWEAVPLVISPFCSYVGDPTSTADVEQLYNAVSDDFANCAAHGSMKKTNLVVLEKMMAFELWATGIQMEFEIRVACDIINGEDLAIWVVRFSFLCFWVLVFDLLIVTLMVVAMEVALDGCHGSLQAQLHGGMVTLDDFYGGGGIRLFMPFFHDDHWWCYSVKLSTLQIFVIDSLGRGIRDQKRIDTALEDLLGIRKKYVCEWLLNNDNIRRMEALAEYGML
ncbi:uncharacterized protein HKW66_Vig0172160 [Vigna angularis]|uniref:Ubiquitin-like protease family profile domain-containing protein n=1 Tax=Phaseolus angularis TaxID=3914 RepID=A0A8T0JTA8_PHAAN|nr:uncharacterized protein HKW66_Vig0172160 [Vigna angularis]